MRSFRSVVMGVSLLGVGMLIGQATDWVPAAVGEVRSGAAPQSFKTGGQLSVPILEDISATLRQMDGRLARMELVAKQMQKGRTGRVGN